MRYLRPPPEAATTATDYGNAIQAHLEAAVKARDYKDAATCASYADSGIASWKADADTFIAWRDAVWTYAYAQFAAVEAGQRTQPTVMDLLAEIDAQHPLVWPS